jgi:hypothetical protein
LNPPHMVSSAEFLVIIKSSKEKDIYNKGLIFTFDKNV